MSRRTQLVEQIQHAGLIAVIRADSARAAIDACLALHAGGVTVLEIAMTTPDGEKAIAEVAAKLPRAILGAGTVLEVETARRVIDAGASFVFAPNVNPLVIDAVKRLDRVMVPGALTPTEVWAGWSAGADLIKLFPANLFGPNYIRDLHAPYPAVKITPTGGVTMENLGDWFTAGAVAVGVGSHLVRKDLIKAGKWGELTGVARQWAAAVAAAR